MVAMVCGGFLGVKWGEDMATRKTGIFREERKEVVVSICDVCGKDTKLIKDNGRTEDIYPSFYVSVDYSHEDDGCLNVEVCSYDCLAKWAQLRILKEVI